MEQQGMLIAQEAVTKEMTPHRVVRLLLHRQEDLTAEEKLVLEQVGQLHPHINRVQALFQHFTQMLRERREEELEQWLHAAFFCGIPELRTFVNKLRQDQAAVQAGLTLKWNNDYVA
jgi:transposase